MLRFVFVLFLQQMYYLCITYRERFWISDAYIEKYTLGCLTGLLYIVKDNTINNKFTPNGTEY